MKGVLQWVMHGQICDVKLKKSDRLIPILLSLVFGNIAKN